MCKGRVILSSFLFVLEWTSPFYGYCSLALWLCDPSLAKLIRVNSCFSIMYIQLIQRLYIINWWTFMWVVCLCLCEPIIASSLSPTAFKACRLFMITGDPHPSCWKCRNKLCEEELCSPLSNTLFKKLSYEGGTGKKDCGSYHSVIDHIHWASHSFSQTHDTFYSSNLSGRLQLWLSPATC